MRILSSIICIQCVLLSVIIGCLLLLHPNLSLSQIFKITYNGGPSLLDEDPLNSTRRLNVRDIPSPIHQDINDSSTESHLLHTRQVSDRSSSRFIFMSCNRQSMFNPFWKIIASLQPNVLIWMGDNIYADHTGPQWQVAFSIVNKIIFSPINTFRALLFRSVPLFPPAPPSEVLNAYKQTLQHPEYRQILEGKALQLLTGTWDDHDYGVNDGDKTYEHRDISKQYLLDFLNISSSDMRRSPSHEGVYGVEYIKIPRSNTDDNNPFTIAIILLDTRYNKDSWTTDPQIADFLGASQWAWFESLLDNSNADVHLVISSIQVLVDHRSFLESWSGFPNARRQLLNTVLRSGAKNPVFLSGDVHFAEISTMICRPTRASIELLDIEVPKDIQLWEFTSSGMTHAARRVIVTGGYLDLSMRWLLSTEHTDVRKSDGAKQLYTGRNIGVLDVMLDVNDGGDHNDDKSSTILSFKILNSQSNVVLSKDLIVHPQFPWLSPPHYLSPSNLHIIPSMKIHPATHHQQWKSIEWTCDPLSGPVSLNRVQLGVQMVFLSSFAFGSFLLLLVLLSFRCLFVFYRRLFRQSRKRHKQD